MKSACFPAQKICLEMPENLLIAHQSGVAGEAREGNVEVSIGVHFIQELPRILDSSFSFSRHFETELVDHARKTPLKVADYLPGVVAGRAVREYSNAAPNAQEANMFRTFAESALSGKPDPHWGEIALKNQQVLDACLRSARSGGRMVELKGAG